MNYSLPKKVVSFTPGPELAELIYKHCKHEQCSLLIVNPQDLVRKALQDQGIISTKQTGYGDRSSWEPGQAIKVSLWIRNDNELTSYATERGTKKQQVISAAVADYLNTHNKQNKQLSTTGGDL